MADSFHDIDSPTSAEITKRAENSSRRLDSRRRIHAGPWQARREFQMIEVDRFWI